MFLRWNDLTETEKEQAENSFLSIMEDVALDSEDEWDKDYHNKLKTDKELRLGILKEKSFIRDKDGYIFVNI
jgi:hypothetical protein